MQFRIKRPAAAVDAAGLENGVSILILEYGRGLIVGKLWDWAAGYFDQDDRLHPSTLNARDFSDPIQLAKDLGCSMDYLLGVMDELTGPPAASTSATKQVRETAPDSGDDDGPWYWWPEQPQKNGPYWCIMDPMSQGRSLYWWSAEKGRWKYAVMAFPLSPTVTIQVRYPQFPESMDWERQEDPNGKE